MAVEFLGSGPNPYGIFLGVSVPQRCWKVANGIRLTGMPAFKNSLSETEMWLVSLLLANANKISDAVKQELKSPGSGPGQATAPPAAKTH